MTPYNCDGIAGISLSMSSKLYSHSRTVYQVFDFIGDVGGFNDAFTIMCEFIMGYYSSTLFIYSLIKSIFLVDLFSTTRKRRKLGFYGGISRPAQNTDDKIEISKN